MITAKNIFIVGIKGVAMTNLALILKKMGKTVSGSDVKDQFITQDVLKKNNLLPTVGFSPQLVPQKTEVIVYSAAHNGINNPQVKEGKRRGKIILSQAEILGQLTEIFNQTIAVCGCHGKTTTASLLAYALINLGVKPSYLVGSPGFNQYPGGDYHERNYFVIEADEYGVDPPMDKKAKFLFLKSKYIICTNIDFDHPDVYKNIDETKKAFYQFFDESIHRNYKTKILICADDKNSVELINKFDQKKFLKFGFDRKADYRVTDYQTNENGSEFGLIDTDKKRHQFSISLFGEKNVSNAAGVIGLLFQLGFSAEVIQQSIKDFTGARRRFELVSRVNSIYLFDDYGHHPKEIESTIMAARDRFPHRRLIVIFQPHTYSRTQSLLVDFAKTLSLADFSLLLPIFPSARENKINFKVTSGDIAKKADQSRVFAFDSKEKLLAKLRSLLVAGDVIFTIGAGDVYKLRTDIIKSIAKSNL